LHTGDYCVLHDSDSKIGILYQVISDDGAMIALGGVDSQYSKYYDNPSDVSHTITKVDFSNEDGIRTVVGKHDVFYAEINAFNDRVTLGELNEECDHVQGRLFACKTEKIYEPAREDGIDNNKNNEKDNGSGAEI
jgi:hypothetical protein